MPLHEGEGVIGMSALETVVLRTTKTMIDAEISDQPLHPPLDGKSTNVTNVHNLSRKGMAPFIIQEGMQTIRPVPAAPGGPAGTLHSTPPDMARTSFGFNFPPTGRYRTGKACPETTVGTTS